MTAVSNTFTGPSLYDQQVVPVPFEPLRRPSLRQQKTHGVLAECGLATV